MNGMSALIRRDSKKLASSPSASPPCEDTTRHPPSMNQEENLPALGTSSLQNDENKILLV